MKSPSIWAPTLRDSVKVTANTRDRLMMEARARWPDEDLAVAMWRLVVDGLDALAREACDVADGFCRVHGIGCAVNPWVQSIAVGTTPEIEPVFLPPMPVDPALLVRMGEIIASVPSIEPIHFETPRTATDGARCMCGGVTCKERPR